VDGWAEKPYYVLISGVEKKPDEILPRRIGPQSSDQASVKPAKTEFNTEYKRLIINLQGRSEIRIKY